jgi:hypothetical protein
MPTDKEILKEASQRIGDLIRAMQKHNIEVAAKIETADEVCIVAGYRPGATGSQQQRCETCNDIVWIDPDSQEKIRARGARKTAIICMKCFAVEKVREGLANA